MLVIAGGCATVRRDAMPGLFTGIDSVQQN
jgi:hypothetical protein